MYVSNREAAGMSGEVNCIIPILHRLLSIFVSRRSYVWLLSFSMRHLRILIDHSCDELKDFPCDPDFGFCQRRSTRKLKQREMNVIERWDGLQCR